MKSSPNMGRPTVALSAPLLALLLLQLLLSSAHQASEAGLVQRLVERAGRAIDSAASALGRGLNRMDGELGLHTDPDVGRSVADMIRSRGFQVEEYVVRTGDGYLLTVQRLVNPLVAPDDRKHLYPALLQHGLMSSSVDWVVNSREVRPRAWRPSFLGGGGNATSAPDDECQTGQQNSGDNCDKPNALAFYLANEGFDVFLGNSRGNVYGQRHERLSNWEPKFWDFTLDEQIQFDLPDTIELIRKLTNSSKLGYVGHSQGTAMMFGLMSERPEFGDIVEPFVALAPVAFVNGTVSPARHFASLTPLAQHVNWWFATSNVAVRYLAPKVCSPRVVRRELCANIFFLSTGFDEEQLDESRIDAYIDHMPSGTSVKNIAHYGQLVNSGRFAKFDRGPKANQARYGQPVAPDYDLSRIRSRSMALFVAQNDWLAAPADVARLRRSLAVAPLQVVNMSLQVAKWNHIDYVYAKDVGQLMNPAVVALFQRFRWSQ